MTEGDAPWAEDRQVLALSVWLDYMVKAGNLYTGINTHRDQYVVALVIGGETTHSRVLGKARWRVFQTARPWAPA